MKEISVTPVRNIYFALERLLFKDMSSYIIRRPPIFVLQWHLTALCDYNCKHCYMRGSETFEHELNNPLMLEECKEIIDDFVKFLDEWGIRGMVNFTGGDPLLRHDFFEIIKYTRKKGLFVNILGNPDHLTLKTALRLKSIGVHRFQLSIDGLENTHDKLRGRNGSFRDTLRAIRILKKARIPPVVMFTLSRQNMNDLIPVIRLVAKERVFLFDFARLVPIGSGKTMKDQMLEPLEYRELLLNVLEEYKSLKDMEFRTYFGSKEPLWKLLYHELGLVRRSMKNNDAMRPRIYDGCRVGMNLLTLLADGTVFSCRRLPIEIGKVPEQSIKSIFFESKELKEMRKIGAFVKCSECILLPFCRGCRAVVYGVSGDYFAPDPQCWKEV